MNFLLAKQAADEASRQVVNGVGECPLQKTGLIVLVFGGDDDSSLTGVQVTANGQDVTDGSGLARFIPIPPATYTVSAARPQDRPALIAPEPEQVIVKAGQCPVVALHMPTGIVPEITLLWAHDNSGVRDAEVELAKSGAPKKTTTEAGIAAFGVRVRPYRFDVKVTFADGHKYLLFEGDTDVKSVLITGDGKRTLKIKRNRIKFHVVKQVGANVEELVGAKVKAKGPDAEGTTALEGMQAVTTIDIPVTERDQKTIFPVDSLTPDATDDLYEVVEVTSA